MPPFVAFRVHCDPVGVIPMDVVIGGVRIGARYHHHAELLAAVEHLLEVVRTFGKPAARAVIFDFRGIKGDYAAGCDAEGIRVNALEVVHPEWDIHLTGIVFGAVELGPTHRAVEPRGRFGLLAVGCR